MHQNPIFVYVQKSDKMCSDNTHYENCSMDASKPFYWIYAQKSGKKYFDNILYENCTKDAPKLCFCYKGEERDKSSTITPIMEIAL